MLLTPVAQGHILLSEMKVRVEQCEMPCCVIAREVVWVERIICGIIK
jgi:hypothetical protein